MPAVAMILLQLSLLCAALVNASPLTRRAYPATGACEGLCQGVLHDPSVVYRADTKTYYRFTTNNLTHTATAPNLSGPWKDLGPAFQTESIIDKPGRNDLWAPDVFFFNGTYYMYYSVSAIGSMDSDIGVATSTTMDPGSWTDHGSIGIPADARWNKIDGNLFQESADAPISLNFGSFWENIWQVPMANPPLTVAGQAVHLAQNTTDRGTNLTNGAMEGSYEFKWNGYYYLFFSAGNCCNEPGAGTGLAPGGEEYHIMVCRSSQQSAGFVDKNGVDCLNNNGGTMVLASHDDVYAPGGQGVMYDPNLRTPVVYYHYVNPSVSYAYNDFFFGWNKLDFSTGWPVVVS